MRLNDKQKKDILRRLGQGEKIAELAREHNVAYNTVKSLYSVAKSGGKYANILHNSEKIANDSDKKLLDLLESNAPYRIVSKIINLLDDDDLLLKEIKSRGVNGVNNIIKTFMDMAMKNQNIKDIRDSEENQLVIENDGFKETMLEAIKSLSVIDTKSLEARESYVQED